MLKNRLTPKKDIINWERTLPSKFSDHFSSLKIAPNWLKVEKKRYPVPRSTCCCCCCSTCVQKKKNQHQLQKHIKINTHASSVTMKKIGQESGSISPHLLPLHSHGRIKAYKIIGVLFQESVRGFSTPSHIVIKYVTMLSERRIWLKVEERNEKRKKKTSPKMMAGVRLPFRRAVPTWGLYSFFFFT